MNSLSTILDNNTAALDPDVKTYIESIIEAAVEDGDCESISDTLNEFLTEETSPQIMNMIQTLSLPSPLLPATFSEFNRFTNRAPPLLPELLPIRTNNTLKLDASITQQISSDVKNNSKQKSKLTQRKEARLAKKKSKSAKKSSHIISEIDLGLVNDDHASAWKECKASNKLWGGRGRGGRGIRITGDNFDVIHLPFVSLCYEGNELLENSKMDVIKGHRYALLGRNGVGKSTLLKHIEAGNVPGLPRGLVVRMVKQQVDGRHDKTTLEALIEADEYRTELLREQCRIEAEMDAGVNMQENAEKLEYILVELDVIDADGAEQRALEILKGLSFSIDMIYSAMANLSGGWRMRLSLAQALFIPYCDLLLLDEITNHLDLHGMSWLEKYLTDASRRENLALICVSHDRSFLDAVCTDVIVFQHKKLVYYTGNYSDYKQQIAEKAARESQILGAAERQRFKAEAFVQKHQQQSKKSSDPNKQRQAKMIKEKKLERIGNYREDGKRWKHYSLAKLSEDHILAEKVQVEIDKPAFRIRLSDPNWPPSITDESLIVIVDNMHFGYENTESERLVLSHVTANITRSSKIAVVGRNGSGKTTLLKLLLGELTPSKGKIWIHPNIRIRSISQYSVEGMNQYSHLTVLKYAEKFLATGSASAEVIAKASGNFRQYLGAFGLGGKHACRLIAKLSGGERMRLCFATALADAPHVLLLDESTNHVDLETLDSLAEALNAFKGSIIMVSHNQGFLGNFCNELWTVDDITGLVSITKNGTKSFDELFSEYRSRVLAYGGTYARDKNRGRQQKNSMARQAAKQRATTKVNISLT